MFGKKLAETGIRLSDKIIIIIIMPLLYWSTVYFSCLGKAKPDNDMFSSTAFKLLTINMKML